MKETILPGHEQQSSDIKCSSCGRFVGALTRCPHCGARVNKRLSVRATRYAAIFLSVVGLGLLYWMAISQKIPLIKIGDITPTMNFAYVRIEGTVTSDTRIFKESGLVRSLRFDIHDDTGEIPVTAYQTQARELIEKGLVPRPGDHISVAGSLSVAADDRILLRIQVADQVSLVQEELERTPINELTPESGAVLIEGTIVKVMAPQPGKKQPWSILIADDSGTANLSFWEDVYADIENKNKLIQGQNIRLRSSIKLYKGKIQLGLARAADLEFLDTALTTPTPVKMLQRADDITIEEITADMKGRTIETEGRIIQFQESPTPDKVPSRIVLEDGTATVTIVYWDNVAQELGDKKPEEGIRLQVRGVVDVYKDTVQLKVNYADQLEFYQMPPSKPEAKPDITLIGEIGEPGEGEVVTVSGRLGAPKSIKSGVIYPVKDKTGAIQMLLWDRNIPGEFRDNLVTGKTVTVTGTLKLYKGELEIIPESSHAIRIH
ncbi:MAG: OB-fold nucleic acid binding domain-containing protein [Kiritimatiellae bacterium]|nr:OB-fold nucleic acid binding domain-containing protein [Kiritimatiellia bacterium]